MSNERSIVLEQVTSALIKPLEHGVEELPGVNEIPTLLGLQYTGRSFSSK